MEEDKKFVCEEELVHDDVVARIKENLPDEDTVFDLAELFKVFGDSDEDTQLFGNQRTLRMRHRLVFGYDQVGYFAPTTYFTPSEIGQNS